MGTFLIDDYFQNCIEEALDSSMKFSKVTWDPASSGTVSVGDCVMITATGDLVRSEPKPMSVRMYPLHEQYNDVFKARELVANGWTQNTLHSRMYQPDGSYQDKYCAVGGLARSVLPAHHQSVHVIFAPHDSKSVFYRAHQKVVTLRIRLEKVIDQVEGRRFAVPGWNDSPGTRQEDVLLVFDAVLDELLREMREEGRRNERIRIAQEEAYQHLLVAFGEEDEEEELLVPEEWVPEEKAHEREVVFA